MRPTARRLAALLFCFCVAPISASAQDAVQDPAVRGPEIRGTVFGESLADGARGDTPLAGATVELSPIVDRWATGDFLLQGKAGAPAVATATTRSDGTFTLRAPQPGLWRLTVSSPPDAEEPGWVTMQTRLAPLYRDVDLALVVLRANHGLALRIVGPGGDPVAGAPLVAYRAPRHEEGRFGLPAPTWTAAPELAFSDAEGVVRLAAARGETVRVQVAAPGLPQTTLKAKVSGSAQSGSMREVEIEEGTGVVLEAFLGDDDPSDDDRDRGDPLPNVLVWLDGQPFPVGWTDARGVTRVVLPRKAGLRLSFADEDGRSALFVVSGLHEASTTKVPLEPAREVRGRVMQRHSEDPVHWALVWSWYSPGRPTFTDGDGRFVLRGIDDRGSLAAVRSGYLPGYYQGARDGAESDTAPMLQLQGAGDVTGLVVDGRNEPVASIVVSFAEQGMTIVEPKAGSLGAVASADDGTFHLRDVPADKPIEIVLSGPSWADRRIPLEPLVPGEVRRGLVLAASAGVGAYGWVVDRGGAPVAGAQVRLDLEVPLGRLRRDAPTTTTDAEGLWRLRHLPPGTYDLDVASTGFAPTSVPGLVLDEASVEASSGTDGDLDLGTVVLVPGVDLPGVVVDRDGEAVAGAEVFLGPAGASVRVRMPIQPQARTVTDDDGGFVLRDLLPSTRRSLSVRHPDYVAGGTTSVRVPDEGEDAAPIRVVLERSTTLFGHVANEAGWPLESAHVVLLTTGSGGSVRGSEGTRTDAQGDFVLGGVGAGFATLQVKHGDLPLHTERVEILDAASGPTRVDVVVRGAEGSLSGTVTDTRGEPVPGATVLLPGDDDLRDARGTTDADGTYRIEQIDPGLREVLIHHRSYASVIRRVEVGPGSHLDVRLDPGLTLRGLVVDGDGLPLEGARVTPSPVAARVAGPRESATSGADGRFVLRTMEPGLYRLRAHKTDYSFDREGVKIELDPAVDDVPDLVTLTLRRGRALEGTVEGVSFEELSQVSVVAGGRDSHAGVQVTTRPDWEGRFRLDGLGPGRWKIEARLSTDDRTTSREVEIDDDSDPDPIVLRFADGYTVRGHVRLPGSLVTGPSAADLVVSFGSTADERVRRTQRLAHDGSFSFGGVEAGRYELRILSRSGSLWQRVVEVVADLEIDIEPEIAGLTGTVRGPDGAPLAGVFLELHPDGAPSWGGVSAARGRFETGADGSFEFGMAPPGTGTLRVHRAGYGQMRRPIELVAGRTTELDLVLEPASKLRIAPRAGGEDVVQLRWALTDEAGTLRAAGVAQPESTDGGPLVVTPVPPGRWRLWTANDDTPSTVHTVEVPPVDAGSDAPLVLDLPPAAKVRLRFADGAFHNCQATLHRGGTPHRFVSHRGDLADHTMVSTGWTAGSFPPGQWTMDVRCLEGEVDARVEVDLVAGVENVIQVD